MARSNTANGGSSYFDLEIQHVNSDDSQFTYRAAIYLTSLPVSDGTNTLAVSGNWSRGGAYNLSGGYSSTLIWSQDVSFPRTGADQLVSVNASFSAVEYFGTTLSASTNAIVPAYAPPAVVPGPPVVAADNVTSSGAHIYTLVPGDPGSSAPDYVMYRVRRHSDGALVGDIQGGYSGVNFTNLGPAETYDAYGQTHNAAGWSAWSGAHTFTTPARAPSPPPAPVASTLTSTTADISWAAANDGGSPVTSYHLQVSKVSNFSTLVHESAANDRSRHLTGLTPVTQYFSRVRAYNVIGISGWSSTSTWATTAGVASAPEITSITNITPTSATVAWSPPTDTGGQPVTSYQVQYSLDPSFATGSTTQSSGNLSGLQPGGIYYVRVRAVTASGPGPWSQQEAFATLTGMKVYNGTSWVDAPVYAWSGSAWVACEVRIWNGTAWVPTG